MRLLSMGCAVFGWLVVGAAGVGCGDPEIDIAPPKPKPPSGPVLTQAERAALPPSKRMLGTWTLDLSRVQEGALNDDLRKLRARGLEDKMMVEYSFHEGEFVLRKQGAGGPVERRYKYEVVEEREDRVELRRYDDKGKPQRIYVRFDGPNLQLGHGDSALLLQPK